MTKSTAEAKGWSKENARHMCHKEFHKLTYFLTVRNELVQFAMADDYEIFRAVCDLRDMLKVATAEYQ